MLLFSGAAIFFAFFPHQLIDALNTIGEKLIGERAISISSEGSHFFVILSVALLLSLTYLCAIIQKNPVRHVGSTRVILLAKFTSSLGFLICFFTLGWPFAYFVAAFVDAFIFLITLFFYLRLVKRRA